MVRFRLNEDEYTGMLSDDLSMIIMPDGKELRRSDERIKMLPPCQPKNILGLALNYKEHAEELNMKKDDEIVLFMKPTSALIADGDSILYPDGVKYLSYEGELAVVVGERCRNARKDEAMKYLLGYTIANDITARDYITNYFRPPVRAKGFDTFLPLGPYIVTRDEIPDPHQLTIETRVNGKLVQKGYTADMLHRIEEIIQYISSFMTLQPEDIILTGTPKGISDIHPGDEVEVSITGLGRLRNRVISK